MIQDTSTLYKLIILYMLDRVNFPLTKSQISDFVLNKEYTDFLKLQQLLSELEEASMIFTKTFSNRTQVFITDEGRNTLEFFENRISPPIKSDIRNYLLENKLDLQEEVSITGEYYKSTSGEYVTNLIAKERGVDLMSITLTVPTEETALAVCDNWQKKNQSLYQYLTEQLF